MPILNDETSNAFSYVSQHAIDRFYERVLDMPISTDMPVRLMCAGYILEQIEMLPHIDNVTYKVKLDDWPDYKAVIKDNVIITITQTSTN